LHQPYASGGGQASDIEIQAKEILFVRLRLNEIYSEHTGRPIEGIARDMERDRFMSPIQAKEYGLIDSVVERRAEGTVKSA
jgi:ATP-dependent Clp protease protease subunit